MLAKKLQKYRHSGGVVLAVLRGGVPVAYAVAIELGLPMDVILAKKIGHPVNKEYAVGAATLTDYFIDPGYHLPEDYIKSELKIIRDRLRDMSRKFRYNKSERDIEGRTILVIDDGIATGHTLLSTVRLLRKGNPEKIVVAVPVAPQHAIDLLSLEADEVVALYSPSYFSSVGQFYRDFSEVTDEEVTFYLDSLGSVPKAG